MRKRVRQRGSLRGGRVDRSQEGEDGINRARRVVEYLDVGYRRGADVPHRTDPDRDDRQLERPGIPELGHAGCGGQHIVRERQDEDVTVPDLLQDVLPPGVAAMELVV